MNTRFQSTVSVADLQRNTPAVLDKLSGSEKPTAVTRDDHAAAVLMSIEAFERTERERHLLLRLAKGEVEIAAGEGYDLDAVFTDAERMLSQAKS